MAFYTEDEAKKFVALFNQGFKAINEELDEADVISDNVIGFINLLGKKAMEDILPAHAKLKSIQFLENGSFTCMRCENELDHEKFNWHVISRKFVLFCTDCTNDLTSWLTA